MFAGKSIKNAVGTEKYRSQHDETDLSQQIGDAKMTFGIFDTERKGYEYLWLLQDFHCKAEH